MKIYFYSYLVLVISSKGIDINQCIIQSFLFSFEKNPNEIKTKVEELRKQFEACHDMISRVEGIDTTIDDQRSELEKLDNELKSKTELLKKHIQMCKFDLDMPPKPTRMTSDTEEDSVNQSSHNAGNAMNINDEDDEDDGDDEEIFQSDQTQEGHHENLSSFF